MKLHPASNFRWFFVRLAGLALPLIFVMPFAAQQAQPPFDEAQLLTALTTQLQLSPEQSARLREFLAPRRRQLEQLHEQVRGLPGNGANPNELRAGYERFRRAVLEELLPALAPEQQARARAMLTAPPGAPASPVAPLRPNLPDAPLAGGERLIALPVSAPAAAARSRRAAAPPALTEDQKILHLLNRAGFGPRPGDIERVRRLGLERYLEEQLHPENIADDFLAQPLLALGTLHLSIPETVQGFMPPPPPRPSPTPARPQMSAPGASEGKDKPAMTEPGDRREPAAGQMMTQPGAAQGEMKASPQTDNAAPRSTPTPAAPQQMQPSAQPPRPMRDPQQPLRELQQAKLLRAVFSERQLQEVMTDFWINHFNVFANKDLNRWLITSYERDVIRPHALGKFKELLTATAQSPAMLFYLDNFLSQAENSRPPRVDAPPPRPGDAAMGRPGDARGNANAPRPQNPAPTPPPGRRPGLNENYARELMELHTLGVDGGYTQQDVVEVARAFTGWTIAPQPNVTFIFRPWSHDRGEKTVLGQGIPAGGGIEDGLRVLDLLARHPSTARFIARKLCQRFVADDPPATLVERVAGVFTKTEGDIREVVRAILTAPEFYSPQYYRAKIKSPLEVVASALRATGATTDGAQPLVQWVARLGEPLYLHQAPTGYSEESAHWINTGTLLERMNFAVALAQNRIGGTRVDVGRFLSAEMLSREDEMLNRLLALCVHSDVAAETRAVLSREVTAARGQLVPVRFDDRAARQNAAPLLGRLTALILGSREFQVK
jgi:uncharacterized protein (DUF1800 family)